MDNIQEFIRDYKQALSEYELSYNKKEYIKEQLLKVIEWQPGTYSDILVSKIKPIPVIEWQKLAQDINLGHEVIKKYTIYRPELLRVSVKRSILLEL